MANMKEKLEEKLHMGGHKKQEPQPHATAVHATAVGEPGYGGSALDDTRPAGGVPVTAGAPQKEGAMAKIKNKVKGKAHGDDSSSSSESDGEGGRRKKKVGVPVATTPVV